MHRTTPPATPLAAPPRRGSGPGGKRAVTSPGGVTPLWARGHAPRDVTARGGTGTRGKGGHPAQWRLPSSGQELHYPSPPRTSDRQAAGLTNHRWCSTSWAGTARRASQWARGAGGGAAGEDGGGGPVAGRAGPAGRAAAARRDGGRADRGAPQTRALAVQTVPGCGLGQLGALGPAGQRHGHDPVHPPHARRAEQAGSRVEPGALLPAGLGDAGALQDPRAGQEEPQRGRLRHLVHQGQDAAGTCFWEQGQLPGAGGVRGHVSQRGEAAGGPEEEVQPWKPARVPLHLGHGEQRLADLRPRPRRAPHRAGRLHRHGAQPQPRHLPGHPLRQEEAHGADRHRRQARVAGLHRRARRAPAPGLLLWDVLGHWGPVRQPRHHLAEAVPADGGADAGGGKTGSGSFPARGGQPEAAGNGGAPGAHEWPGPVPHRLLLAGGPRLRHRHRHHPLQQVAGAEPQALLLSQTPQPPVPGCQGPPRDGASPAEGCWSSLAETSQRFSHCCGHQNPPGRAPSWASGGHIPGHVPGWQGTPNPWHGDDASLAEGCRDFPALLSLLWPPEPPWTSPPWLVPATPTLPPVPGHQGPPNPWHGDSASPAEGCRDFPVAIIQLWPPEPPWTSPPGPGRAPLDAAAAAFPGWMNWKSPLLVFGGPLLVSGVPSPLPSMWPPLHVVSCLRGCLGVPWALRAGLASPSLPGAARVPALHLPRDCPPSTGGPGGFGGPRARRGLLSLFWADPVVCASLSCARTDPQGGLVPPGLGEDWGGLSMLGAVSKESFPGVLPLFVVSGPMGRGFWGSVPSSPGAPLGPERAGSSAWGSPWVLPFSRGAFPALPGISLLHVSTPGRPSPAPEQPPCSRCALTERAEPPALLPTAGLGPAHVRCLQPVPSGAVPSGAVPSGAVPGDTERPSHPPAGSRPPVLAPGPPLRPRSRHRAERPNQSSPGLSRIGCRRGGGAYQLYIEPQGALPSEVFAALVTLHPAMASALRPLRSLSRAALEPCARRLHLSAAREDAVVISGRKLARQIRQEARHEVQQWVAAGNRRPHLSVVLVGENPASHSYVLNKTKAAADVGISSETILRPASISEEELLELIARLNSDTAVDGLLVQLPLPEHIDERRVCNAVSPHKDVDGFHVLNVGRMCLDQDSMLPATPRGVWEIIQRTGIPTLGRNVVVAGRSKNVGMPIAMLLHTDGRHERPGGDATVTISHRYTPKEQLKQHTIRADIVVAAAGIPNLITADMVKEGAAVIDVGITRVQDPLTARPRLVGDVDFEGVRKKASYITPVPGGVGPMTVAMLMKNTIIAAKKLLQAQEPRALPA